MTQAKVECDVIVVGAGLSGLACASLLCQAGLEVVVLEAGDRVGGRIHSVKSSQTGQYLADLGPTWVWPQFQPIVEKWLQQLGVQTFAQFEAGDTIFDIDASAAVQRHRAPGQDGICRLMGGPQALIDALMAQLPEAAVRTGQAVVAIELKNQKLVARTKNPACQSFEADQVVIAAPLRIARQNISWPAGLDQSVLDVMHDVPTWMSTQAKMVALYDKPFWRETGLCGRVISQAGPLVEIHDHCGPDDGQAALFGFIGWPPDLRGNKPGALSEEITRQLVRCFGPEGGEHIGLVVEDWAINQHICSTADLTRPPAHPEVVGDILRQPHCDGQLYFAVAETALQSPGLIEGAFVAAEMTAASLIRSR